MSLGSPLDLDLEDRLIYGLSPQRFGYLVLAGLAAMAVWSQRWLPGGIRIGLCIPPLILGVAFAWGGWRGRSLDLQVYDAALFMTRNYRLEIRRQVPRAAPPVALPPPISQFDPLRVCSSPGLECPS